MLQKDVYYSHIDSWTTYQPAQPNRQYTESAPPSCCRVHILLKLTLTLSGTDHMLGHKERYNKFKRIKNHRKYAYSLGVNRIKLDTKQQKKCGNAQMFKN